MTLTTLVIGIAIAAVLLTILGMAVFKRVEHPIVSYLQNFCGALFVFSGWVKAIDPLGTAYKMEQYFAEFESAFAGTWFSFLSPMFPKLAEMATGFSVGVIVFEIVLGIMLLIGSWRQFTAWAFFLLVAFFTFLTGFTYLTGYVPEGVNFFQFAKWGPYVETNMKVTDCGCFGDFLKLEPKVSFLKDVFLLFPAIIFVVYAEKMHKLFSTGARMVIVWISIAGLLLYCISNFQWDLPHTDFRPFKNQANIRIRQAIEEKGETSVQVTGYRLTNNDTEEKVEMSLNNYLKNYKQYPKEEWTSEQIKSDPKLTFVKTNNGIDLLEIQEEPALETDIINYLAAELTYKGDTAVYPVEHTKISDFDISNIEGEGVTYDLLHDPNYSFMVVAYKLYGETGTERVIVNDTLYVQDTVYYNDSIQIVQKIDRINKEQVTRETFEWNEKYLGPWMEKINPVLNAAKAENYNVYAITSFNSKAALDNFKSSIGADYPVYMGDDILLKTIVRSNPGLVLLKNGEVIMKWHHKKLPDFATIKAMYMKE